MLGYLYTLIYFFFRDLNKISDGIGSKFGRIISSLVSFVSGYVIGFIYVWQLTLVEIATFPLVVFVGGMFAKVGYSRWAHKEWGREGKEEGRKRGMMGRKEGREKGREEGRKGGRKEGRKGERKGGREGGREGGMEAEREGWRKEGRKEEKKKE